MTIRLTFDLDTVCEVAEHAAAAATGTGHADAARPGPALLLRSGSNGIWLTSNGPHPQPAPANQPGTLDRRAAFARQCPPGTPWLDVNRLLRTEAIPLRYELPLHEPTGNPLLGQLRVASLAGATTVTVLLSGTGIDIAVGRRRDRATQRPQPADDPADAAPTWADQQRAHWQGLLRQYRPLPRFARIRELMARVEVLRADNARLYDAHLTLVGFGVLAHRDEFVACAAAIEGEADTISGELHALGAHEAAQLARDGWTMTLTRHHTAAPINGN
ncbi:hypothetical protein [Dactylosporangium sp. CA-092794]|uniref:hypothetical protein n=1 Tax=Dactylosporangium sp. CA-092794 TaxID=3239929 RepID=UPI003D91554F